MVTQGQLLRKSLLLTASRIANLLALYFRLAGEEWLPKTVFALASAIFVSTVACYLALRPETGRLSGCPAAIVALAQVGAFIELCHPWCPAAPRGGGAQRQPTDSIELKGLPAVDGLGSFASSIESGSFRSQQHVGSTWRLAGEDPPEDIFQLRLRILRKMTLAQVPEAIVSAVLNIDLLIWLGSPQTDFVADQAALAVVSGLLAIVTISVGISDMIICMWVQTNFVQANPRVVILFYFVEICSWWPFLTLIGRGSHINSGFDALSTLKHLAVDLAVMVILIMGGFYAMPGGKKFRGSCLNIVKHFTGQLLLAMALAPFLVGTNLLFFDSSLTFRPLNRWYYPFRHAHLAYYFVNISPTNFTVAFKHHFDFAAGLATVATTNPIILTAVFAIFMQMILVWLVIPRLRKSRELRIAEEFAEKTLTMEPTKVTGSRLTVGVSERGSDVSLLGADRLSVRPGENSRHAGLRVSVFQDDPLDLHPHCLGKGNIIAVLNAVGDTFEALLLASQADSPRVRCAVLGVAIRPLCEAGPAKLGRLLPLILPQLLLVLRWRTVEDGQDELCPLTHFIVDKVLALKDKSLASLVYWQLLGLSADHTDKAHLTYRAVRLRLLHALQDGEFDDRQYDHDFCEDVLSLISNQRRLCYQLRAVCRTVQNIQGSNAEKNAALRQRLGLVSSAKRWRGQSIVGGRRGRAASSTFAAGDNPTASSSSSSQTRRTRSSSLGLESSEAQQHEAPPKASGKPKNVRVAFAPEPEIVDDNEAPQEREGGRSDKHISRIISDHDMSDRLPPTRRCPCGYLCWRRQPRAKADPVREEWELEPFLKAYENVDLDLSNTLGVPLPVDPKQRLGSLESNKSFVANSGVAPVVVCYREADEEGKDLPCLRRLYAIKRGDDLRQDALVLQFFQLMETVWAEHGLNVSLRPYTVLALSPKEGLAAFVPKAKNISSVLQEYEGDVNMFIQKGCGEAVSAGYDRLCGSTAGYAVATYLLGIGDRHLDNIMITEDGHLFHIDFGFVLGDDPKPGAPIVRVPREILEALKATGRYDRFKHLVGEAFKLVRSTARLWTALLSLAARAGGNGVSVLRDDAERAMHTVRERLHLELEEDAAAAEIVADVEEAAKAILPVIFDKVHQAALFWH
eukprot:TRINITY_DN29529_c0_g1_i1.p1 TRINITY_DN29529_c0_g1~~TRINITY_DN29529_c0_g1_i1.p1  ORF type:complete len:1136 (+),score=189.20 TRINITY_DN29529_c0_g1_i1:42-3449(+)